MKKIELHVEESADVLSPYGRVAEVLAALAEHYGLTTVCAEYKRDPWLNATGCHAMVQWRGPTLVRCGHLHVEHPITRDDCRAEREFVEKLAEMARRIEENYQRGGK